VEYFGVFSVEGGKPKFIGLGLMGKNETASSLPYMNV
jgi:hypothetical protein